MKVFVFFARQGPDKHGDFSKLKKIRKLTFSQIIWKIVFFCIILLLELCASLPFFVGGFSGAGNFLIGAEENCKLGML